MCVGESTVAGKRFLKRIEDRAYAQRNTGIAVIPHEPHFLEISQAIYFMSESRH
jgi:hypothetical protein